MQAVPDPLLPAPLPSVLQDLSAWLGSEQVPWILIGGLAASLLGRPRLTRDVDALAAVEESRWEGLLQGSRSFGFLPRIADPVAFAQRSRVLLIRHEATGIDVDLILGELPFEAEAIRRGKRGHVGGLVVPLATPEDLVVMKAVAGRPRDLEDIEGILAAHPGLDARRVRTWLRRFSEGLEAPGIASSVEKLLRKRRKR